MARRHPRFGWNMAFFDFIFGGDAAQLKKHARRVADRDAQAEDREASARWLFEQGTDEATVAMFGRFNLQLEHSMKDQKEKDYVLELLVERGGDAARAARRFAHGSPNFQYPLRLLERLEGSTAGAEIVLELLAAEKLEDEWKPEKKRNLLISLAERKHPAIVAGVGRFLEDFDEGVRNAAIEAIAAQEGEAGREALLPALLNEKEESTRIRGRLAELFAARRWSVPVDDAWFVAHVPTGFRIEGERLVAAR